MYYVQSCKIIFTFIMQHVRCHNFSLETVFSRMFTDPVSHCAETKLLLTTSAAMATWMPLRALRQRRTCRERLRGSMLDCWRRSGHL